MTDLEEEPDDDEFCAQEVPEGSTLEAMCCHYGLKYYEQGRQSGDLYGFYDNIRKLVLKDFKNYKEAHDSVNNFLIDSYIYYRRVSDKKDGTLLTKEMSASLAIRDTMMYLSLLKNDFPFRNRTMGDDW